MASVLVYLDAQLTKLVNVGIQLTTALSAKLLKQRHQNDDFTYTIGNKFTPLKQRSEQHSEFSVQDCKTGLQSCEAARATVAKATTQMTADLKNCMINCVGC